MSTRKRGPKEKQVPGYVVSSKIPSDLMTKLEVFSLKQGRSYSWVLRTALQKFLLTYEDTKVLVSDLSKTYVETEKQVSDNKLVELAEQDAEALDRD